MENEPSQSETPAANFPQTQWSLIDRAAKLSDAEDQPRALAIVLNRYLPAMRAHLSKAYGMRAENADDVLQGFIADKVIEQNLLEHARQEKGKFRSFLLVTLNHYVVSEHRRRVKPAGTALAMLGERAEQVPGKEEPEVFTLAWARELLTESLRRMKRECNESKRSDVWRIFEARIVQPIFEGERPISYQQLVDELKLPAPLVACNLLMTAKRMFIRNLRAVTSEYADSERDIDEELADLRRILSSP